MKISIAKRLLCSIIAGLTCLLILTGSTYISPGKKVKQPTSIFSLASEKQAITLYNDQISKCHNPYSFCKIDRNILQNDSSGMSRFYEKLISLRKGKIDRVNVVQIGDSHLQSGFIPFEVRNGIQGFFGDAGRGLVFPYETVGVGEAYDISIHTQGWKSGSASTKTYTVKKGDTKSGIARKSGRSIRSLNRLNPGLAAKKILKPGQTLIVGISYQALPQGFCGYTLKTFSSSNSILLRTRAEGSISQKFNLLTLLVDSTDDKFLCTIEDESGNVLKKTTIEQLPYAINKVPINWTEPVNAVRVKISSNNGRNPAVILYGISLERTQPGIMYHSIGLNGAGFDRYTKNAKFFDQLRELKPDLVIISLGTNDAMGTFRHTVCEQNMNEFIKALRSVLPNTDVLMTTPPDSYKVTRKGKVENQAIPQVRDLIKDTAVTNGFAWWNLYDIMGGQGSMKRWVSSGLAQYDHKHFNANGYREQGYLLRDSILQGYASYVARLAE